MPTLRFYIFIRYTLSKPCLTRICLYKNYQVISQLEMASSWACFSKLNFWIELQIQLSTTASTIFLLQWWKKNETRGFLVAILLKGVKRLWGLPLIKFEKEEDEVHCSTSINYLQLKPRQRREFRQKTLRNLIQRKKINIAPVIVIQVICRERKSQSLWPIP